MTLPNKRLAAILLTVVGILLIPFIAMQFTQEVQWTAMDFVAGGSLLLGAGLVFELILRKVKTTKGKLILGMILFALLLLVWAELAVGIFGTPLAGQ